MQSATFEDFRSGTLLNSSVQPIPLYYSTWKEAKRHTKKYTEITVKARHFYIVWHLKSELPEKFMEKFHFEKYSHIFETIITRIITRRIILHNNCIYICSKPSTNIYNWITNKIKFILTLFLLFSKSSFFIYTMSNRAS